MSEIIKTKVRGVDQLNPDGSSRQQLIRDLVYDGAALVLEREPENRYDPNAIAVLFDSPNLDEYKQIGYLSRDLAAQLAPLMDAGQFIDAEVLEVTGQDQGTLGVNIQLTVLTAEESHARRAQFERLKPPLAAPPKPADKKKPKSMAGLYIILILIVLCIIAAVLANSGDDEPSMTPTETAWYMCRQFIEDNLKAPSTAKFERYNSARVRKINATDWTVTMYVDAENSFGAMIRSDFTCQMRDEGETWRLLDLSEN